MRLLSNKLAVARIPEHLQAIVGAVAEGGVQTPPFEVLALDQAAEAQRRVQLGHVRGKLLWRVG